MFENLTPSLPPAGDSASNGLAEWKTELRRDFESWLESLDHVPVPVLPVGSPADDETPDIYSFYKQLAAANSETRKSNRRVAEAFSQWGDTLARFESQLAPLRETAARLSAAQPDAHELPRSHCLLLMELLDRMHRVAKAFHSSAPRRGWWPQNDAAWRKAWETQRQAFDILVSHLDQWLRKEGVSRINTLHQPFDPTVMTAVAAEKDSEHPAQTVLEEVTPGYVRHGELLRPAQVKVSLGVPT